MDQCVIYRQNLDEGPNGFSEVGRYYSFEKASDVLDSIASSCNQVVRFENKLGFWGTIYSNSKAVSVKMWIAFE